MVLCSRVEQGELIPTQFEAESFQRRIATAFRLFCVAGLLSWACRVVGIRKVGDIGML